MSGVLSEEQRARIARINEDIRCPECRDRAALRPREQVAALESQLSAERARADALESQFADVHPVLSVMKKRADTAEARVAELTEVVAFRERMASKAAAEVSAQIIRIEELEAFVRRMQSAPHYDVIEREARELMKAR